MPIRTPELSASAISGRHVFFQRLCPVASHERVDRCEPQHFGRPNHRLEVVHRSRRFISVRTQWIWVVTKATDLNSRPLHHRLNLIDPLWSHPQHINVTHPSIATLRPASRPATDLDAVIAETGRGFEELLEGQIRQNGTDKTKLHWKKPCEERNGK